MALNLGKGILFQQKDVRETKIGQTETKWLSIPGGCFVVNDTSGDSSQITAEGWCDANDAVSAMTFSINLPQGSTITEIIIYASRADGTTAIGNTFQFYRNSFINPQETPEVVGSVTLNAVTKTITTFTDAIIQNNDYYYYFLTSLSNGDILKSVRIKYTANID